MEDMGPSISPAITPWAIALCTANAIPGTPAQATFVVENLCNCDIEVLSSAFEIKRSMIGARHALPRAGWGYAVTTALPPGTVLPAHSELWTKFHADTRTTFHGALPAKAPPASDPQYYFSGRILYRRFRGELFETTVYRRLSYADMSWSIVDPCDVQLNKTGAVIFLSGSN
jgi:hypothetical protein